MVKTHRIGKELPLLKEQRQFAVEAIEGKGRAEIAESRGVSPYAITKQIQRNGVQEVINTKEIKRQENLAKISAMLQEMIVAPAETKLKHADKIKAAELQLTLDGHLQQGKEEKHLHLHGDLAQLTEAELRKQLGALQGSKAESGVPPVIDTPLES